MTFHEYFKITRFKNRKSFDRPSLLFVLLVVILLISITTFIRRWCQYCSDGLSVAPPQSVIGAFLSFVYAAYTSAVLRNEFFNLLHLDFVGQKYIMSH